MRAPYLKMPNIGINMPNMSTIPIRSKQGQPLSMVDALFSKTQQSVLALLFGQPGQSFYTNEIFRKSGGGSGAVQRELSRLVRSGLATVKRIGSQNHYQANPDAPLFVELCSIVNKTVALVEPIKSVLQPFLTHIELAFVYGSVAKKSDTASSDIDLMIISDSLTYAEVFTILEEVSAKLQRNIQPTIYSPEELTKRIQSDNSFIKRVLKQSKVWIIGKDSELPAG
jgi:predicted nucleotidyltransferase